MAQISFIQHTADKGIRVNANTLEELFTAALEGMARIQRENNIPNVESHEYTIEIVAPDATALLIDFLSEVLTLSDIHNILFTKLSIQSLTDTQLQAVITGTQVDSLDEDIKAVTHSQADIHRTDDGRLETIVVFDM